MEDAELSAMQTIYKALEGLGEDARQRTLTWAAGRFDLKLGSSRGAAGRDREAEKPGDFGDVAELVHAAQPKNGMEYALVSAYWLQVVEDKDGWSGKDANSLLKNLGHGLSNVTTTMNGLIKRKPAWVMQTKKSGRSAQSKKTYKLTVSGVNEVERMLSSAEARSDD
jgi:hypothetical protein